MDENEVITLNRRPEFYQVISREEDNRMMMKISFIEGEQAWMKQKTDETARKMKNKKLSFELISEITGLDINTIKDL